MADVEGEHENGPNIYESFSLFCYFKTLPITDLIISCDRDFKYLPKCLSKFPEKNIADVKVILHFSNS